MLLSSGLLLPLSGVWLWWGSLPLLIGSYFLLQQWQRPLVTSSLSISQHGDIHWLGDGLPAGRLMPQSLVCSWGVWLYWQDDQQQVFQYWLYQDNFSRTDFRALARHCQLARWQQRAVV